MNAAGTASTNGLDAAHFAARARLAQEALGLLTRRERDVVYALGFDLPDKLIADRLGCRPTTIQRHMRNISRKLGVKTRVGIALKVNGSLHTFENSGSIVDGGR